MKNVTRFISAAAALMLVIVSCAKQELPVSTSGFEMNPSPVVASAQGGVYSVAYQISLPEAGATVEAVSPQGWVNGFDYSIDGVISFNVEPNEGAEGRETVITVLYGDKSASFPVSQYKPTQVLAADLENMTLTAIECAFDRENTIFRMMNPESLGEPYTDPYGRSYITAGQFASQYASAYNLANPDDMQTADDFLSFVYTEPTLDNNMTGTFFDVYFYTEGDRKLMSVSDGQYAPAGNAEVIRMAGEYTYDEETGIISLYDDSNTMEIYHRPVEISIQKEGRYYRFEVVKTEQPDYMEDYLIFENAGINLMKSDRFGFVLSNYSATEYYIPYGPLVYTLKEMVEE